MKRVAFEWICKWLRIGRGGRGLRAACDAEIAMAGILGQATANESGGPRFRSDGFGDRPNSGVTRRQWLACPLFDATVGPTPRPAKVRILGSGGHRATHLRVRNSERLAEAQGVRSPQHQGTDKDDQNRSEALHHEFASLRAFGQLRNCEGQNHRRTDRHGCERTVKKVTEVLRRNSHVNLLKSGFDSTEASLASVAVKCR